MHLPLVDCIDGELASKRDFFSQLPKCGQTALERQEVWGAVPHKRYDERFAGMTAT